MGGALVHQQNLRVGEQGPGNGQPLLFSAGEEGGVLPDGGVDPLGQPGHHLGKPRFVQSLHHLLLGIIPVEPHVFQDGVVKEEWLLGNTAQLGGIGCPVYLLHIHPVQGHSPGLGRQQPLQEFQQGGFSAARLPVDDVLPPLFKGVALAAEQRAIPIGEGDVVQGQAVGKGAGLDTPLGTLRPCHQLHILPHHLQGRFQLGNVPADGGQRRGNVHHQLGSGNDGRHTQVSGEGEKGTDDIDAQVHHVADGKGHLIGHGVDQFGVAAGPLGFHALLPVPPGEKSQNLIQGGGLIGQQVLFSGDHIPLVALSVITPLLRDLLGENDGYHHLQSRQQQDVHPQPGAQPYHGHGGHHKL